MYESEEKDDYEPVRTGNVFSSSYIEYESSGDKDRILSIKEYLQMIKPYLSNKINNHKTRGEWKIQLTPAINFMTKYSYETRAMHSTSDDIETMIGSETDEIIEELFNLF